MKDGAIRMDGCVHRARRLFEQSPQGEAAPLHQPMEDDALGAKGYARIGDSENRIIVVRSVVRV